MSLALRMRDLKTYGVNSPFSEVHADPYLKAALARMRGCRPLRLVK